MAKRNGFREMPHGSDTIVFFREGEEIAAAFVRKERPGHYVKYFRADDGSGFFPCAAHSRMSTALARVRRSLREEAAR